MRFTFKHRRDRSSSAASAVEIQQIIELLTKSPIPASYQEALLNSLHTLTSAQASEVLFVLTRLLVNENSYIRMTTVWMDTWQKIAKRIHDSVEDEANRIEAECIASLERKRSVAPHSS